MPNCGLEFAIDLLESRLQRSLVRINNLSKIHIKFAGVMLAVALFLPVMGSSETLYGSFLHDERLPESLFLTGEIRQGDSFELRKALRDHDISIVIMGSAGGNLYEGLQMGSILRDKGISTYVPPSVNCESSCANMFFGGAKRKADGQLGVHQFYSANRGRSASRGEAEEATQYTMANLIGIMNELDTPPFVFEKMLATTEMHYFSDHEKSRLELNGGDLAFSEIRIRSNKFIEANPEVIKRPQVIAIGETAEAVAPSVRAPYTMPLTAPSLPNRGPAEKFDNIDFFGADLYPKGVRGISLIKCEQTCRDDGNCAAFSYVHATQWCWPKSGVTNLSYGIGITSGIVDETRVDRNISDRPFLEMTATDLHGNDLLQRGMHNTTLDECRGACLASTSCRAFTWVGKKNICFLKYGVGRPTIFLGAISGIKQ